MAATVALIVDMQVDFFAHDRLSRLRPRLVASTNALVVAARKAAVPVVWIKQEFSPDLSDAPLEVKRKGLRVTVAGTPGASFLPELDVQDRDLTIVKTRYSAFFGTHLDSVLAQLGCDQLIVAGINTHACIRATVVDAYQRDYDVILARDCTESHDEAHHEQSSRYMIGKLARGMSNEEIFAALEHRRDPASR
jgi:nicotinamidase-related amidase